MRLFIIILFLSLASCGRESSPEGRSKIRDESLQQQMDTLNKQNKAMLDSIKVLRHEVNSLKDQ